LIAKPLDHLMIGAASREVNLRTAVSPLTGGAIRKNISIDDRRTTIVLEQPVWDGLLDICRWEGLSLDALCETIVRKRGNASMSSMLRTTLLEYYRVMAERPRDQSGERKEDILATAISRIIA
jgi:predicted DNA-binding ribbon-helix-helix protein